MIGEVFQRIPEYVSIIIISNKLILIGIDLVVALKQLENESKYLELGVS